jgi:hypothetical protein
VVSEFAYAERACVGGMVHRRPDTRAQSGGVELRYLALESNVWDLAVCSYATRVELSFQQSPLNLSFCCVHHKQHKVRRTRNRNHLLASPLPTRRAAARWVGVGDEQRMRGQRQASLSALRAAVKDDALCWAWR